MIQEIERKYKKIIEKFLKSALKTGGHHAIF